jgi:putative membrane protein insertion efficiency factor
MSAPLVNLPRRLLMALVRGYRLLLSPWLGNACRFEPTCSAYALEALERHGAAAGAYLGACRIVRCHPWCQGGLDPVPADPPRALVSRRPSMADGALRPLSHSSKSDRP